MIIKDNYLGFCPVKCEKDYMVCPGPYDFNLGKQMGQDTCMPQKNGNCNNYCAKDCMAHEQKCPGGKDLEDCPLADFCYPAEQFCPVNCGKDEQWCPGPTDKSGPEFCMPSKNGGDCPVHCPVKCGKDEKWCSGGKDDMGCEMPESCVAADSKLILLSTK